MSMGAGEKTEVPAADAVGFGFREERVSCDDDATSIAGAPAGLTYAACVLAVEPK